MSVNRHPKKKSARTRFRSKVTAITLTHVYTSPFGYDAKKDTRMFDKNGDSVHFGRNVTVILGDGSNVLGINGSGMKGYHRHTLTSYVHKLVERLDTTGKYAWDSNAIKTNYTGGVRIFNDDMELSLGLRDNNPISDLMGSPIGAIGGRFHADPLLCDDPTIKPVLVPIVRTDSVSENIGYLSGDDAVTYLETSREIAAIRAKLQSELEDIKERLRSETDSAKQQKLRDARDKKENDIREAELNQRFVGGYWAIPPRTTLSQRIDIDPVEDHVFGLWLAAMKHEFINHARYGGRKAVGGKIKWQHDLQRYDDTLGKWVDIGTLIADPDADEPVVFHAPGDPTQSAPELEAYLAKWYDKCEPSKFFEVFDFTEIGRIEAARAAREKKVKTK
jgi:hypothetical protein